jgi:hypothetical protein
MVMEKRPKKKLTTKINHSKRKNNHRLDFDSQVGVSQNDKNIGCAKQLVNDEWFAVMKFP